mmetsp:Transcript_54142/g.171814  ORF Transcript_54142/g.171814 Transcript_54142/m.171814 type:complete len:191 (-) Transcript_54142:10-582(-)
MREVHIEGPRGGFNGGRGGPGQGRGPRGPPVASAVTVAAPVPPPVAVDREKTCPLLLRVFPKVGDHHRVQEFAQRGKEPAGELQIYTWKDATLRELTELVKAVRPEASRARLGFAFVYPDRRGNNVMRPVGSCFSVRRGEDDDKTLQGLNFQTGDYLDVAIYPFGGGGGGGPGGPGGFPRGGGGGVHRMH